MFQTKIMRCSVLLLITCFYNCLVSAQTDFYFKFQEEIDDFDQNLTVITGNLTIIGFMNNSITDLSALSNIIKVDGDIIVENNNSLTSLDGLQNITEVGGQIRIRQNTTLTDLSAINSLITTGGFKLDRLFEATDFPEFENLVAVEGDFELNWNIRLKEISGFENLTHVAGNFIIGYQDSITQINGFTNLKSVGNRFVIRNNEQLNNIDIFETIESFGGNVEIRENAVLSNIDGLVNVDSIFGKLDIRYNDELTSIEGLRNLEFVESDFTMDFNSQIENLFPLNKLKNIGGTFRIANLDNVLALVGLEQLETTGGLEVLECARINTLNELSSLEEIDGNLRLYRNQMLLAVKDTNKFKSINGNIEIEENGELITLLGLDELDTINGNLVVFSNLFLPDLDVLSNIKQVNGDLKILNNPRLKDIDGLSEIEQVGGVLEISSNSQLTHIDALDKLTYLKALELNQNFSLESIEGLGNVERVDEHFKLINNAVLSNCCPIHELLRNPDGIGGDIEIFINDTECDSYETVINNDCIDNFNGVFGQVFYDTNQNKVKDENEYGVPNIIVEVQEDSNIALTNNNGNYGLKAEDGENYTLGLNLGPDWEITSDQENYEFQFVPGQTDNFDFGVYNTSGVPSAQLSITSAPTRCNTTVDFYVKLSNNGFIPLNGFLNLYLDELVHFVSAEPQLFLFNGVLSKENISLEPFESIDFIIKLKMAPEDFTGEEIIISGEFVSAIFVLEEVKFESIVLCSFDPNDKIVNPIGIKDEGYTVSSENLFYTIRFQNTGNSYAEDVRILDTLSENLDLSTFSVLNSSHPVRTNVRGRAVEFLFEDIFLIDSTTNATESQGFVQYSIKPLEDVQEFSLVENTAHIIFDFNPAIITNTTANTMVDSLCEDLFTNENVTICEGESYQGFSAEGVYEFSEPVGSFCTNFITLDLTVLPESDPGCIVSTESEEEFKFIAMPNPTNGMLYIQGDNADISHQLIDSQGKVIMQFSESEVSLTHLARGIYFLKSFSSKKSFYQKIIKY